MRLVTDGGDTGARQDELFGAEEWALSPEPVLMALDSRITS